MIDQKFNICHVNSFLSSSPGNAKTIRAGGMGIPLQSSDLDAQNYKSDNVRAVADFVTLKS